MPINWRDGMKYLLEGDPADGAQGQLGVRLPNVATASLAAAAAANEGAIVYDTTTNTVKFSDGSSWDNIGVTGSIGSLQQVTTVGATSNVVDVKFTGASSAANSLEIGDGTDHIDFYASSGDCHIVTVGSADLTITPDGGNLNVVGAFDVTGAITQTGDMVVTGNIESTIDVTVGTDLHVTGDTDLGGTLGVTGEATFTLYPLTPIVNTAAGTLTLAGQTHSTINTISTNAAADCVVTLDATTARGYELTFDFVADGGFDVVVNTAGADVIHGSGGIAYTSATMADEGDYLILRKTMPDTYIVVAERGCTFA